MASCLSCNLTQTWTNRATNFSIPLPSQYIENYLHTIENTRHLTNPSFFEDTMDMIGDAIPGVCVVVVVTLFPTKIHENTHMYNTLTVVSPQNVRMYFVSGCQKKLRLIELAAATCYLQFCRATARTGPEEMTHWHPGGRFKESFSSNGFHNIYSIILSRIISRYVPFHQMSF